MPARIPRDDLPKLRKGVRVFLSYDPETRGEIITAGLEVSDVLLDDKSRRFVCNEFLKIHQGKERVKR